MFRIAVVEDEEIYQNQMKEYLETYEKEKQEKLSLTFYQDGEDIIEKYQGFDIIFLDIQMQFLNGMDAAKKIRELDQEVIIMFITNMTQYAIQGYQVNALDYIVKPVEYFPFSEKLTKALNKCKAKKVKNYILVPVSEGVRKIDLEELYYIESCGHNLIYQLSEEQICSRGVLKEVEKIIQPYDFYRCSKGFLVNMKKVDGVKSNNCLIHGKEIAIGRNMKKRFMELLIQIMSEVIR